MSFSFEIDFASAAVARQESYIKLGNGAFKGELARARTFGFLHEVDQLRKLGLARGGSLDNAIVINGDKVLNEGGLRFSDEFVRHKILDSIGDLYLAGAPILGHFHGCRSGHALNNQLLRAMFADKTAWCYVDAEEIGALPMNWGVREKVAAVAMYRSIRPKKAPEGFPSGAFFVWHASYHIRKYPACQARSMSGL